MTDRLEWGGWVLEGELLLAPRRARLFSAEAKIVRVLLEARIAADRESISKKTPAKSYVSSEILSKAIKASNPRTLSSRIAGLRHVIGEHSVVTRRDWGYRMIRATRKPVSNDPVDDLIANLTAAIESAKRLKLNIKEGLYE